uniref:Family with sequence similarity 222 member Ba n=1 Tax=Electrophorus electricus TaxID=8005 RepID=A0AAY5EYH5_ELEEL
MLACLPGPGDLSLQLLPHSQMNTGLQKWDTTRRMRSAQYPTPAELDAYAKKVANSPLTIKIFPNSVKVPQRSHVRRTVNGLDTGVPPRYSPYPQSQPTAKAGLLAIVKAPAAKGIIKDFAGTRARPHPEASMSAPGGPYGPPPTATSASTLALQHGPQPLSGPPSHQPALQPQQTGAPPPGFRHHPAAAAQHPQGLGRTQPLSHAPQQQPHPQQQPPPPGLQGSARKLLDADAPPNVTVSTSTIPLSMAGALHQGRPADLSSIVHQINQFCQARAQGAGATSVCEGQIANPSPISRSLLIDASSRVAVHGGHPAGPPPAAVPGGGPPHGMGAMSRMAVYHGDVKPWGQHQLAHLQQIADGAGHPCKPPSRDTGYPCKGMNYPPELCMGQPYTLKPPVDKPTPSPPVVSNNNHNGMPAGPVAHYTNGQYYHQPSVWGSILPTPNSDSSGSQELPAPFHGSAGGANPAAGVECAPVGGTAHYRPVGGATAGQTNLMQTADYMGGDFQTPCFRDQNLGLMGKMHRPPPMGRVVAPPSEARGQHPGYR